MAETREEYNARMRVYMLKRYHARMSDARERLGSVCVKCGDAEGPFDLDHIDPSTKSISIGQMWSVSKVRFEAELAKCQLLCKPCHETKSILDAGKKPAKGTHGTLSAYRYCKCELCKGAQAQYMRDRQARLRSGTATGPDF